MESFNYQEAFSRNIGWITPQEQEILKNKTIAIAGMGGVGGFHLLTLCRLGLENFHISDFDNFELANFNRQVGATVKTLHKPKQKVLEEMAKDINPNANIKTFDAITASNVNEFLNNCELYVDGMDFFCIETRELLYKTCFEKKIPVITAAPLGMGVYYIILIPGGMDYKSYFQWDNNNSEEEKLINFAIGLSPKLMSSKYLMMRTKIDFKEKKGPSTIMACMLCAGVAGVESLKILLKRGKVYGVPYYQAFDAYLGKYKRGYLLGGNKNPIQYIKRLILKQILKKS